MSKRILFIICFVFCIGQIVKAQKSDSGWYVAGYSEQAAMNYFTNSTMLEPIEGIWQSTDGFKYSIEKDVENSRRVSGKYRVIVLESSSNAWNLGQIKGFISPGSVEEVYSFKYYTRNTNGKNTESQNVLLVVESPVIMTFQRIDGGGKISMYRIYPQVGEIAGGSSVSQNNAPQWYGSGIVIADKYIATNNHVVEDAISLVVCGIGGDFNTTYKVQVVAVDKNNDLAVVKVVDEKFQGFGMIPYGFNFSTVDVGTEIFALGYPKADMMGNEVKVTNGIINSKTGYQGDVTKYQMSATIDHGNSGGPVFDYKGNLIGISQGGIGNEHARNVNYAVKSVYLQTLIQSCTEKINIPKQNIISNFQLSDKIKAITPFVLMIVANMETNNGGNVSSGNTNGLSQGSQMPAQGSDKEKAEYLEKRAREKYNLQDYAGAYADIVESVKLYPKPETHDMKRFLALSVANDTLSAIESLNYCIDNKYELENSCCLLGYIFLAKKKYNEAIPLLTNALVENKKNVDALFLRGSCKSELKDKPGAIADFMQAIKYEGLVDSDYAMVYNGLAYTYLEMNNFELADKYIKEALKREHMEWYVWDTDGELAYKSGDYQRCVSSMSNAITIKGDKNSYYYRAMAKIKLNNLQGAYRDIESLKILDKHKGDSLANTIDMSKINFEQEDGYENIITSPRVNSKCCKNLYVKGIEQTSENIAIHFIVSTMGMDELTYNVDKKCYIQENNNKHYLIKAENIAIYPKKTEIGANMKKEFVLYFPAVDKDCQSLDITNEIENGWWMKGIKMESSEASEDWNNPQTAEMGHKQQKPVYVEGYGNIDMVWVEGGTFMMGATGEQGVDSDGDERPVHKVALLDGYYIGKYEVTQGLWRVIMGKTPPKYKGDNYPVENITWVECQDFISKLNALTSRNFRLPSEAEWEYAARGGIKSRGYKYSGSDRLNDVAWHKGNSGGYTHPVGTKQPNELGIYDMSGNVIEWCNDYYGRYRDDTQANPTGPNMGTSRVLRGGGIKWEPSRCRVSARKGERARERDTHFGFRLACD